MNFLHGGLTRMAKTEGESEEPAATPQPVRAGKRGVVRVQLGRGQVAPVGNKSRS